ncbi:hypothetical protein JCM1840_000869 [Sporobolomyces johnsonii]
MLTAAALPLAILASASSVAAFHNPAAHNHVARSPRSHHSNRSFFPARDVLQKRSRRARRAADPSSLMPGSLTSAEGCTEFYHVNSGDYCYVVVDKYKGLTLDEFYRLNPEIDGECHNLWAGYDVCVSSTAKAAASTSSSAKESASSSGSSDADAEAAKLTITSTTTSAAPQKTTTTSAAPRKTTTTSAAPQTTTAAARIQQAAAKVSSSSTTSVKPTTTAEPKATTSSAAPSASSSSSADADDDSECDAEDESTTSSQAAYKTSSYVAPTTTQAPKTTTTTQAPAPTTTKAQTTTSSAAAAASSKVYDSSSSNLSLLSKAGITGFLGDNTNAIVSWYHTDSSTDSTNGHSWCGFPYSDSLPGFAPSLSTMLNNFGGNYEAAATAYCGLEAVVTTPDGRSATLYIADAFDDTWVRTPASIDVIYDSFAQLYGSTTNNKDDVVQGASWILTGNRNEQYKFKGVGSG